MTSKKKSVSKLASGVRQVKLQREQAHVAPAKTVVVKAPAMPAPTATPTRPNAPSPAIKADMNRKKETLGTPESSRLHPQRVWPD